jgi:hypothetical protein
LQAWPEKSALPAHHTGVAAGLENLYEIGLQRLPAKR